MRVELTEDIKVKGTPRKAGETVVVRKEEGERLIEKGLAVRLVEEPENRVIGKQSNRFATFDRFGR